MKMKSTAPSPEQLAYRQALEEAMRAHGATLPAEVLLAITAHLVGQLVALQDQLVMTPAMAMELIGRNIEQGNSEVIEQLLSQTGGRA